MATYDVEDVARSPMMQPEKWPPIVEAHSIEEMRHQLSLGNMVMIQSRHYPTVEAR